MMDDREAQISSTAGEEQPSNLAGVEAQTSGAAGEAHPSASAEGEATEDRIERRRRLLDKLNRAFPGKIVRKDLTTRLKEGANVPVYVLEYLLGQFCTGDDPEIIEVGLERIKGILRDNFVRPDEAQIVLSRLRKNQSTKIIDKVSVSLNTKQDRYEAELSNLGRSHVPLPETYADQYERLLCGGIWCMVTLRYEYDQEDRNGDPVFIQSLKPIQMPSVNLEDWREGRRHFTVAEWREVLLRSVGLEPDVLTEREQNLLLLRLVPLVEKNFNLCELGPRSTGKSHVYKEISPNSILVSGGQTTVANLFYNMSSKAMGLVGLWDCVAFDEVAGISFKDKDGVQIMKDYMNSGSFARGKESKTGEASMVFVGNINQSVETLLKTSTLFQPFPAVMGQDTAFLDRMHCYLPGWEVPKFSPSHFTKDYGFITDYLAEVLRELRKSPQGDALDRYFTLGKDLNQRDTSAVRRMVSGLLNLLYPNEEYTKEELESVLVLALEMRRRVKEQLKKLAAMEFFNVNFSYRDRESGEEKYVTVPEQGGGCLVPEVPGNPGQVYAVAPSKADMWGVYRLDSQVMAGNGKLLPQKLGGDRSAKESANTAFNYLRAHALEINSQISTVDKDYVVDYIDLQGRGLTSELALPTLLCLCSVALGKPVRGGLVVLGNFSVGGTVAKLASLADALQVCKDAGAGKVLIPLASVADVANVPPTVVSRLELIFYNDPIDAVFKALMYN